MSPRAEVDGRRGRRGRKGGSHSKSNGGLPGKRSQYQKATWMRRRLRGKQPPLGMTAYARVVHAKAIHNKAGADCAKAGVAEAPAALAEAPVAVAEAEARRRGQRQ